MRKGKNKNNDEKRGVAGKKWEIGIKQKLFKLDMGRLRRYMELLHPWLNEGRYCTFNLL